MSGLWNAYIKINIFIFYIVVRFQHLDLASQGLARFFKKSQPLFSQYSKFFQLLTLSCDLFTNSLANAVLYHDDSCTSKLISGMKNVSRPIQPFLF